MAGVFLIVLEACTPLNDCQRPVTLAYCRLLDILTPPSPTVDVINSAKSSLERCNCLFAKMATPKKHCFRCAIFTKMYRYWGRHSGVSPGFEGAEPLAFLGLWGTRKCIL